MENLKENIQRMEKELAEMKAKLEQQETQYPIYCKDTESSLVVRFDNLQSGEVVVNCEEYNVGHQSNDWINHADTNVWQQLEVDPDTGFFDGKAVWCWNNNMTHRRELMFFDAKNKRTFNNLGRRDGSKWDNYEPYEGNYKEWMLKAFNTLER